MKTTIPYIKITALYMLIALASGCKKDKNIDDPNYLGSRITLFTTKVEGQSISLYIDADPADRADVWIDLNNNKQRDEGESITKFGFKETAHHALTISSQTVTIYGKVTGLQCSNNQLSSLDLTQNTSLTHLYCYDNHLTSLDLSKNPALTQLYCYENRLSSLNLSKNTKLMSVMCFDNQLSTLDLTQNTVLNILYCHNNQLTSLDLSKNTELEILLCLNNQLTSLDLSKNTKLDQIYCYHNKINQTNMNSLLFSLVDRRTTTQGTVSVYKPSAGNSIEGNWQPTTQLINNVRLQKNWIVHVN